MGAVRPNFFLGAAALALIPTPAWAQSIAPTRDELTRPQSAPTGPSNLNIVGDVERSSCPLADPQYSQIKVTIADVQFNGLKGASAAEMRSSWNDFAGSEQPVSVICEIRDRAATYLREQGYLAAVQVPTQRIENGVVRLEVLYARITTVRARGQTAGAEAKLVSYLERLTDEEVFNRYTAERYMLLARDLPGYNVQMTLKPAGTAPGDMIAEVSVLGRRFSLDAMVQNLAARETGRFGAQLRAQAFGLTGLGDATFASFYSTLDFKEQQILQLGHSFRPGSEGLTLNGQFTYAWTKPDIGGGGPDVRARTLFATIGAAYPIIRSQERNLTIGGGFDFINQKVKFFVPLTEDKLRVLWLRADFNAIDLTSRRPRWQVGGTLEVRKGLDIFGASDRCCSLFKTPPSRVDGNPTGFLIRGQGNAEFAIGEKFAIAAMPRFQIGFNPLFAFEEFTGGNYTVGRGYDPAIITGDSGLGLAFELRGPRLPLSDQSRLLAQPFLFGDAAWVWNKNTGGDPDHIKSIGGGIRAVLEDKLSADFAIAVPLEKAGPFNRKGDVRFLFTITTRLVPWR